MAVRDGPMTPTERVNRIWLIPGANNPVTKNGHVSRQATPEKSPVTSASSAQMTPAIDRRDERRRLRVDAAGERETDRDGEGAEENAELAARSTTKIGAARFELATSASQRQHSNQAELRPAVRRVHL